MATSYPVSGTRATTQQSIARLLFQIHTDQSAITDLQTQLSTGRRISKPSQNPGAAIRALAAQRGLEFKSQVADNIQSADTILSSTESTLSQAQAVLTEMRGLAVVAASNTLTEEEILALGVQVGAALQKLQELGNAKFRDQFLFAGSHVLESPLDGTGDTVRFNGDEFQLETISDFSSTIAANVTANDAFGVISERVTGTADLNPSVLGSTPLASLNRGSGVRLGAFTISNGVELVQIDLSNAHDLDDVIEKIEATTIDSRELTVSLSSNGIDIEYADGLGGLLRVRDIESGNVANDLGINTLGSADIDPVIGTDLDPIVTPTTLVSQLFDGSGVGDPNSFLISQGGEDYLITTSGVNTVEDLINRIHLSGASVRASLDSSGRYLELKSTESGSTLSIGENGSDLATLLGIRTFTEDTLLSELNLGEGIYLSETGADLVFTRNDGTEFEVDLGGTQTVADVLLRINNNVANFTAATRIVASISSAGNGLVLTSLAGAQEIGVRDAGGSHAAYGLGLVNLDEPQATGTAVGTDSVISGRDVSGIEVDGAFNSLIRLRQAIESGRVEDIGRIAASLESDLQRVSLARGYVGTRQQSIDSIKDLTADQQLLLTQVESDELDADLASVISELSSREAALQASLQLMGQTTRLTLFDYL
ncbi:MAG: hypothetical protein KDB22_09680 [Planctomycetales bacterium]|nr:hypothetical protein [Planctomycetales bacterium]